MNHKTASFFKVTFPILPIQERTWPLWHGSLIDHDVVTWENLGMVDFFVDNSMDTSNGDEEITQLKWESNSLTFDELIFFGWNFDFKKELQSLWWQFQRCFECWHWNKLGKWTKFDSEFVWDISVVTTKKVVSLVQFLVFLPRKMTRKNSSSCRCRLQRQFFSLYHSRKLMPLDLLDLQGNEGLVAAAAAPVPDALLSQVQQAMQRSLGGGLAGLGWFWSSLKWRWIVGKSFLNYP